MNLKTLSGIVSALTILIGTAFFIDARYYHTVEAAESKSDTVKQIKQTESELKIEIYRQKIAFLNSKAKLSADERDELEFTRKIVERLQSERLQK
ncbi:MAG: hypothetical protein QM813_17015 [Verrucomicrobiota bacterium]